MRFSLCFTAYKLVDAEMYFFVFDPRVLSGMPGVLNFTMQCKLDYVTYNSVGSVQSLISLLCPT